MVTNVLKIVKIVSISLLNDFFELQENIQQKINTFNFKEFLSHPLFYWIMIKNYDFSSDLFSFCWTSSGKSKPSIGKSG